MLAQSPPRPPVHYYCKTRRGVVAGGIHETRVAAGGRWGRERSTGLCWWDQRRRLARGGPPCGCLPRRQTTGPAHSKALLKRACAHICVQAKCTDSEVSSMRLECHSRNLDIEVKLRCQGWKSSKCCLCPCLCLNVSLVGGFLPHLNVFSISIIYIYCD